MMKLIKAVALAGTCLFLLSCHNQTAQSSQADIIDGVAKALERGGKVDLTAFQWTREPAA